MPRILLAEDDEIIRISVSDRLKRFGWQVDEAEDGLIALRLLEKNQYHLVLSDIRMPNLDGIKLLAQVKKQSPETDVFIMTAYGSIDDGLTCLRQGAADYILKPFDMDDLVIRLNRLLELQEFKNRCAVLEANCKAVNRSELIGDSAPMQQIYSLIEQAGPSNATILITGESGTG